MSVPGVEQWRTIGRARLERDIGNLGTPKLLGTPSNSDRGIEKDKARMLHARATGQPVIVTRWWPGIEQWLYDELMLVPGKDVFVPDAKMTKEQVLVERTRWRNRKRYQQSREGLGMHYRERSKRVSETLADSALSALRQVGVGENPSPAAPAAAAAADKLAGVNLSGVRPTARPMARPAVRTDTRTVTDMTIADRTLTPHSEETSEPTSEPPASINKLANFRIGK